MANSEPGQSLRERIDRLEEEVRSLRSSRKRLLEASDTDRRAIERAIHDGVMQDLVALAVDLRNVSRLLQSDQPAAEALLDDTVTRVQEALDGAATLAQTIHPPLFEARGLRSALRSAAAAAGVALVVDIPNGGGGYLPDVTSAIYWTCVEMLSSAPRASEAAVTVHDDHGTVVFEVAIAGRVSGDRLERVRDRIDTLGGRVEVADLADGGSRLQGRLPPAS